MELCKYSNSVIYCDDFSTTPKDFWYCDILAGNNSDLIRNVLKNCTSEEYKNKTELRIYKYATFDVPLTVELDIGPYITQISFVFDKPGNIFQVSSFKIHPSVTFMHFSKEAFILIQSDFFEFFPNLNEVRNSNSKLLFSSSPSFQSNLKLANLDISVEVGNVFVLDNSVTRGLVSLTRLSLTDSGIQYITHDALNIASGLTELNLQNNQIQYLPARVFDRLTNLEILNLDNNLITASSPDAFYGLYSLTLLSLESNEYFPVSVINSLNNLESLLLRNNNYTTLNPFPFQQLGMLTYIDLMDNPLDCNCRLQWLSYATNYGIVIRNAVCVSPTSLLGTDAITPGIYGSCGSVGEFRCFNRSVTCPYNQVCQNIAKFHFCCCPEDHRMIDTGECVVDQQCRISNQTLSDNFDGCGCIPGYQRSQACMECIDINECETDNGGCKQNCENTIGSFRCFCDSGYVLHNFTQCDVNECQDVGLMCNGICENTIGSYICHCWRGFTQQNDSLCVDIDECVVSNAGCEQICHNTQGGYFCSCYEGFNLTLHDIHVCQTVEESIFVNPTISIAAIGIIVLLIVLLIIQTLVCVTCICCTRRKSLVNPSTVTDRYISNSIQTVNANTNLERPYVEMSPVKTDPGACKDGPNKVGNQNPLYEFVPTGNTLSRNEDEPSIVYGEFEDTKDFQ